jgi:carbonic anhydrase
MSCQEALRSLVTGNARYVANAPRVRDFSAGRAARVEIQAPFAAILSCADSRVAPELVFDGDPGDLFVVRLAGNVVNPDVLASLEYTVALLRTPLIVVLGHSGCGAVDAAIKVAKHGAELPGISRSLPMRSGRRWRPLKQAGPPICSPPPSWKTFA